MHPPAPARHLKARVVADARVRRAPVLELVKVRLHVEHAEQLAPQEAIRKVLRASKQDEERELLKLFCSARAPRAWIAASPRTGRPAPPPPPARAARRPSPATTAKCPTSCCRAQGCACCPVDESARPARGPPSRAAAAPAAHRAADARWRLHPHDETALGAVGAHQMHIKALFHARAEQEKRRRPPGQVRRRAAAPDLPGDAEALGRRVPPQRPSRALAESPREAASKRSAVSHANTTTTT